MKPIIFTLSVYIYGKISHIYHRFFFRENHTIKINELTHIYFNRTDRIGDAIVSLPFFIALEKRWVHFTVLTSSYNNWVLAPFVPTQIVESPLHDSGSIERSLLELWEIWSRARLDKNPDSIFVDLKQDLSLTKKYRNSLCVHFENLVLNTTYSDIVLDDSYVFFSHNSITEKCRMVFKRLFNETIEVDPCPAIVTDYAYTQVGESYARVMDQLRVNAYWIILLGTKEFRNLNLEQWYEVFSCLPAWVPCLVIDDQSRGVIQNIDPSRIPASLILITEPLTLWEIMSLSGGASWLIWVDGGGFNFAQMATNSFGIYTTTSSPRVWMPYSGNPISSRQIQTVTYSWTETIHWKCKAIIHPMSMTNAYFDAYGLKNKSALSALNSTVLRESLWDFFKKINH